MKILRVNLPEQGLRSRGYDICIGKGLLESAGEKLRDLGYRGKAVIITNPVVRDYYAGVLKTGLEAAGFDAVVLEVPEGEKYKSMEWAGRLYNQLSEHGVERMTPVLAVGGGVIGDLAGFVAATYMRGIPLVQVPTTLLAQVDSSTGGKVAVDHGHLKNMVGSFYQPSLVIADVSSLSTLPESEFINGLSELVKHAIILDRELFGWLESRLDLLRARDAVCLEDAVYRSVGIKAGVVEKDEEDRNLRNILNFGHTIGHALETVSDFKLQHGRAVAIGMAGAARISQKMGFLSGPETGRIRTLLVDAGLPVNHSFPEVEKIIQAMKHDKKRAEGKSRFVLLRGIGEVFLSEDVSDTLVEEVVKELYAETPHMRCDSGK
ncbi:MAG: 3-dehydroquinate synthase [Dehalococcoidales bacterium]|nr:3-dehydroquinate synthase [Dehalococcoidales bacterium]